MALEKSILKSQMAAEICFDYKPKEFSKELTSAAVDFVALEDAAKNHFKMSDLVAQQSGVSKLEAEKNEGLINEQVLDRLKEVQERAYKEAYDLGHQEGKDAGFQEHKADLIAKIKMLDTLIESIEKIKTDLLRETVTQFVELTFEIGKRIALRDLSQNKDAVVQLLQQAVGDMQNEQQITVHAAKTDLESIEAMEKTTEIPLETLKRIKVIPDSTIEPGGCVIDLKSGQVNLRIPDRVERVWEALQKQITINQKS